MIEGAAGFHYIGLVRCDNEVMMVFREGVLVLDTSLPGWGIMPPAELARLLPHTPGHSPSPSPRSGSHSSSDSGPLYGAATLDELVFFEMFSDSCSTANGTPRSNPPGGSGSDSGSRSASPSPRSSADSDAAGAPERNRWSPAREWLGWAASDAPVQAGPVTQDAVAAYLDSTDESRLCALERDFLAGRYAPHPPAHPPAGLLARVVAFGEPALLGRRGDWAPAGSSGHGRIGLSNALACDLVAHAHVASHCNLSPVREAGQSVYHGMAEDDQTCVLVFDTGLLVQRHPDADLRGWHPLNDGCHWDLILPINARRLLAIRGAEDALDFPVVREFMSGHLRWTEDPHFAALLWSMSLERLFVLHVPHGLVHSGAPGGPDDHEALAALQQAPWAAIHDRQRIRGPLSLGAGRWRVPVVLGALRCLMAAQAAPALVHDTWHATLQPAVERLLLAHRAQEKAWLATGVIRQPVDGLVRLMQRDQRLRRPEVYLMWPVALLADLFKTLAPHARVTIDMLPRVDALSRAMAAGGIHLVVFQHVGAATQSVAIAMGVQCWDGDTWDAMDALRERVTHSFASGATEHLVAIATVH